MEFVYCDGPFEKIEFLLLEPFLDEWIAVQQGKESASCSEWQDTGIMLSLQSELILLIPEHCC